MKKRIARSIIGFTLALTLTTYSAVVSDNDGSAFITKAEFDSLKNNFQSQIDGFNSNIDGKIDSAIAAYLTGIKISASNRRTSNTSFFTYPLKLYGKRIIKTTDLDGNNITQVVGVTPPTNTHYEPLFSPDYVAFGHMIHGKYGENSFGYYYHKPTRYINKFYDGTVSGSNVKVKGTYLPGSWTWTGFEVPDSFGAVGYVENKAWTDTNDGPMYWSMSLCYKPSGSSITCSSTEPYEGDLSGKMYSQFNVLKSTTDTNPHPISGAIGYRPYSFADYGKKVRQTDSAGVGGGSRAFYYGYCRGGTTPLSKTWSTNGYAYDTIDTLDELDIFSVSGVAGTNNTTDYQVPVALGSKIYITNFTDKINVHNTPTGRKDMQSRTKLNNYDLFQGFVDAGFDLESEMQTGSTHAWSNRSLLQSARLVYDVKFDNGYVLNNNNMTHMIPVLSLQDVENDIEDGSFVANIELDILAGAGTVKIAFAKASRNIQSVPADTDANFLTIIKANGVAQSKVTATCANGSNKFYIKGVEKDSIIYYKLFWDYSTAGATVSVKSKPVFEFSEKM